MTRRLHPADIATRVMVAAGGGYLLTLLTARLAAAWLPLVGSEAMMAASLGAWLVFLAVAIWAFAARTPALALAPVALLVPLLLMLTP